jgi:hypothetical protein
MIVACGRGVQVLAEWELAVSRFQPDSQGSLPAATRTLARLSSPYACSMPGWVKVAGAAAAVLPVRAVAEAPTARAAVRPPAVFSRPRRLNSVLGKVLVGGCAAHSVHLHSYGGSATGPERTRSTPAA